MLSLYISYNIESIFGVSMCWRTCMRIARIVKQPHWFIGHVTVMLMTIHGSVHVISNLGKSVARYLSTVIDCYVLQTGCCCLHNRGHWGKITRCSKCASVSKSLKYILTVHTPCSSLSLNGHCKMKRPVFILIRVPMISRSVINN